MTYIPKAKKYQRMKKVERHYWKAFANWLEKQECRFSERYREADSYISGQYAAVAEGVVLIIRQ